MSDLENFYIDLITLSLALLQEFIMSKKYRYIRFFKPYGVLSQFSRETEEHITLADFLDISPDIYPIGRLDKDSEGLLLLTNDNDYKTKMLSPKSKVSKTYLVQVDGEITSEAMETLKSGVEIKLKKGRYKTKPCSVLQINVPKLPDRFPPVRFRKNIPTSWIKITLFEGKNRQIRKMCAAVGFPVLRLVRVSIGEVHLAGLGPGDFSAFNP